MTARLLMVTALLIGISAQGLSSQSNSGQAAQPAGQGAQSEPLPVFRVGVDVIRIDAVVTDRDGRMVTDLTADDFEIRQDGKLQAVVAARFVSVDRPAPAASPLPGRTLAAGAEAPRLPTPGRRLTDPSQVQRTIAIVVDEARREDATRRVRPAAGGDVARRRPQEQEAEHRSAVVGLHD